MDKRHILCPLPALLLLIALAMACGSGSDVPPEPTRTVALVRSPAPTATPLPMEPTHTPTPVQTPQADIPIDELWEELSFFPGAGGDDCGPAPAQLPSVMLEYRFLASDADNRVICLWGFPLDEQITVSFYAPNGDLLVSGDFIVYKHLVFQIHPGSVRELVGSGDLWSGGSVLGIDTAWPATLPREGRVTAVSASAHAESPFDLGLRGDKPRVRVLPTSWENGGDPFILDGRFTFSPGDEAAILGTGFEPNNRFPLGIYWGGGSQGPAGELILSKVISTDDQGNFHMRIQIDPVYPEAIYYVVVVSAPPDSDCFRPIDVYLEACIGPLGHFRVR